jgi:prevent-host-death family protein
LELALDQTISAAEANRKFSEVLRGVREGRTFIVTSHGRPVARIVPANSQDVRADAAWLKLLARLERQPSVEVGPWTRDELYDD